MPQMSSMSTEADAEIRAIDTSLMLKVFCVFAALALLSVAEDFVLMVRAQGSLVRVLLSDVTAAPDWSLERAAMEMAKRHIRHLVVVDSGELVGILSMRDIVRCWTQEGATSGMTPP